MSHIVVFFFQLNIYAVNVHVLGRSKVTAFEIELFFPSQHLVQSEL